MDNLHTPGGSTPDGDGLDSLFKQEAINETGNTYQGTEAYNRRD